MKPEPGPRPVSVGLKCTIGRATIAVPVEAVDGIVEYEVTRALPLSRGWIGGIGLHERRVLVSIALVGREGRSGAELRRTKGVLLDVGGSELGWALEVAEVASFVEVTLLERLREGGRADLPAWITAARAVADGSPLAWLDVGAMIADLSGQARVSP